MHCKNCGKENKDGAAFCMGCGSSLQAAGKSDGPTAVFTAPKKKNIAAIALGALSVILAIALALSLTGVLGGGAAASKSFATPEDAINYFVDRLKAGDFDGALNACAIGEMAKGFDYKAFTERLYIIPRIEITYLPSEYKQYITYNRDKLSQQIIIQMASFAVSFNLAEDYRGIFEGESIQLKDGKLPEDVINELDPSKLGALKLVDIGKANMHDSVINRKNQKEQAKMYSADDMQFRTVLYEYDGKLYVGGFTVLQYGGRWMIQNMSDPLAGISAFGTPTLVEGRQAYEDMLE